jgi:hypothetical protein
LVSSGCDNSTTMKKLLRFCLLLCLIRLYLHTGRSPCSDRAKAEGFSKGHVKYRKLCFVNRQKPVITTEGRIVTGYRIDTGRTAAGRAGSFQSGRTSFFPVTALRAFTTGRTVTFFPELKRSGPPGGGPARVVRTGAGGRGGSAGQTNRHGESADQEILIRRDVGDEPAVVSNGGV